MKNVQSPLTLMGSGYDRTVVRKSCVREKESVSVDCERKDEDSELL
jgi:hypothetical protein